jgi:predicted dehydrogenase
MEIRYGLIATAAITKRFIGAVQDTGGILEAIGSRNLQKAKEFANVYRITKAYGSYEEVYQDEAVNVVYIATINEQHADQIKQALRHHKHVLCEKPIVLNRKDAKEIFTLAKENNVFVMEMQKSVFLPITNLVKEYIDTKKLGSLLQIEMNASFENPTASWMHEPHQGGVVYGSASYTIEYLDYLLEPKNTVVQSLATKEDTGTINQVNMNIKMDQVLIISRISMGILMPNYATFYFEKGYLVVEDYWKARKVEIHTRRGIETITKTVMHEMQYEVEHIEECIQEGLLESPIMSWQRTMKCITIVDQIIKENR